MSEMAKGFAEGLNPIEFAKDTVELGKAVVTGTGRAVIYQITTSEEDKQKDAIAFLEHTLAAWQQLDLSKMSRKEVSRTTGRFLGQIAAGKLMAKGAKFATGVIRKGAEVLSEIAESSKTSKAITVEEVMVKAPQAAEDTSILKSTAEKVTTSMPEVSRCSTLSEASRAAFKAAEDARMIFVKNKHLNIGSGKFAKFATESITIAQN